jgi:hypothetical protein
MIFLLFLLEFLEFILSCGKGAKRATGGIPKRNVC